MSDLPKVSILQSTKSRKKYSTFHLFVSLTRRARSSSSPAEFARHQQNLTRFYDYLFRDGGIRKYIKHNGDVSSIEVSTAPVDKMGKQKLDHFHTVISVVHASKTQIDLLALHRFEREWFGKSNSYLSVFGRGNIRAQMEEYIAREE